MTRSSTRTIEIDAEPDVVFDTIKDPRRLSGWALDFVDAVEVDAETGAITARKGDASFGLRVLDDDRTRTVDFLVGDASIGAYCRVLPTFGGGSVVTFTQPVPPDAAGRAAAERTVETELWALKAMVEPASRPASADASTTEQA